MIYYMVFFMKNQGFFIKILKIKRNKKIFPQRIYIEGILKVEYNLNKRREFLGNSNYF